MDRERPRAGLSSEGAERLLEKPWAHGFLSLMRRINANQAIEQVGTALLPLAENFRIGQKPSLSFAPSEVAEVTIKDAKVHMRLNSLGMFGPNGPLPIHVTEIARERETLRGDATLSSFLDLFHHRALTIFFRSWASAQAVVSLDRGAYDRYSFRIGCFSGMSPRQDRTVSLAAHARLAATPHLVREARNAEALCAWVSHHFGVPVEMVERSRGWSVLPPELRCHAGRETRSAMLGGGAMLGEQVPGVMHRFCLIVGPLDMQTYQRFTPRGEDLLRLVALVRAYMGLEFEWILELRIKPDQTTPAQLGESQQLGWSSWLGDSPSGEPIVGMRFEPELYVDQLVKTRAARTCDKPPAIDRVIN